MSRLLFPFFCLLCVFGKAQSNPLNFTVKGFLPYWKGASFTLSVDGRPMHATTLQNDMLSFSGYTTGAKPGVLEIKEGLKTQFLLFFIEPGVIKIRDKGRGRLEVVGTPTNDTYLALIHQFDSLVLSGPDTAPEALMVTKKALAKDYIRANPNSIISLQLLHDYFFLNNARDDTAYTALYEALDPALKQTTIGVKIGKEVALSSRSALGVAAVRLQLPDSSGTLVPVYNTGEYTLIHFWASWCLPCKKELPHLSAIHQRFGGNGFTLTGISYDQNKTSWKRAAQKLPWKQLIDVGAWYGKSAAAYGVKVVPQNILLDSKGTIIAKNLSMEALEKKLSALLQPKAF